MKEKALKLADELEDCVESHILWRDSANMLRELVDELDKAESAILDAFNSGKGVGYVDGMRAVKQKPLSDAEIDGLAENCWYTDEDLEIFNYKKFAVLLQERHGIK